MGVHLTFVRSVDLDEWTQRQIDAMRIGGNDNAKKFFKKQGVTDFHNKVCVCSWLMAIVSVFVSCCAQQYILVVCRKSTRARLLQPTELSWKRC